MTDLAQNIILDPRERNARMPLLPDRCKQRANCGPITSAVIGFICLGLARTLGWTLGLTNLAEPGTPLMTMLAWLGYINSVLAVFNMIPGFPMDGGRVLRAIVWWKSGDVAYATRVAARTGQFIAFGCRWSQTGGSPASIILAGAEDRRQVCYRYVEPSPAHFAVPGQLIRLSWTALKSLLISHSRHPGAACRPSPVRPPPSRRRIPPVES